MVGFGVLGTVRKVLTGGGDGEKTPAPQVEEPRLSVADDEEEPFNTLIIIENCDICEETKERLKDVIEAGDVEVLDADGEELKPFVERLEEIGYPLLADAEVENGKIKKLCIVGEGLDAQERCLDR